MKLHDNSRPAGNLHSIRGMLESALIVALLLGTACFIPPPYADELDANPNYPPVIKGSTPAMPGPVTLTEGNIDPYTLVVDDKDVDDTLYVRVFRNYPQEFGYQERQFPAETDTPSVTRTFDLDTRTWCANTASGASVFFDIVIADRPFDTNAQIEPINRVVQAGGELSIRSWFGTCL